MSVNECEYQSTEIFEEEKTAKFTLRKINTNFLQNFFYFHTFLKDGNRISELHVHRVKYYSCAESHEHPFCFPGLISVLVLNQ